MTSIPFVELADPRHGELVHVAPLIQRVVAANPSKYTYRGTGTYIVGADARGSSVAVIDPGPRLDSHRDALVAALAGRTVSAILVTHCHADHSPLAAWLRDETGAPTLAFGPHPRPPADLVDDEDDDEDDEPPAPTAEGEAAGADPIQLEESTDHDFEPDRRLVDGEVAASGPGWTLRAVHTPGHTSNHLCFAFDEQRALFTGDHIMGWSTTVIGPPDGDMRAYLLSLQKVRQRDDAVFYPTHGSPVADTRPFLDAFVAHRLAREDAVLDAVRAGRHRIRHIVQLLYADVRKELYAPARRSVLSHLIKLVDDGLVAVDGGGPPRLRSTYVAV